MRCEPHPLFICLSQKNSYNDPILRPKVRDWVFCVLDFDEVSGAKEHGMKIVLLGHREFASNLAMSLVARQLTAHKLSLFLSGEHSQFGLGAPSVGALEQLEDEYCSQLMHGPLAARARRVGLLSFEALAELAGQPIRTLAQPNSPAGLAVLKEQEPDLLLSLRYRRILHADAIALARHGVINWHSGLLPEYQGVMATFWAMQNGDSTIGSTVHYIVDKSIDTGPVIARCPIPCRYDETYLGNVHALYIAGFERVVEALSAVEKTGAAPQAAQSGKGKYYRAPSEDNVREFGAAGHRLYDGAELERTIASLENAG